MTLIQIILLAAVLILLIIYLRFLKNRTLQRVFFTLFFLSGIVAVALPDWTNKIANFVGVGRGADLLLYLMVVIFYFAFIVLYRKIEEIKERQTEIIRQITLQNVVKKKDER